MMKKIFSIMIALMLMVMSASAQNYVYPGHLGMPYVGINGGVVTALDAPTFGDAVKNVTPVAGVELGTYFTPVWGVSAEGVAVFNLPPYEQQTILNSHYVLGNGKMNLSNFLAGYKGYPRRVEFVLVAGAGWGRSYTKLVPNAEPEGTGEWILTKADGDAPEEGDVTTGPLATYTTADQMVYNTGAEININLGKARAWQLNVRPSVIWNHPNGGFNFDVNNATARVTLGVTYKFGNRRLNSHNFVKNNYAVSQYDYDILAARYDECSKRPAEIKEVPVEKVVEKTVTEVYGVPTYIGERYITFPIGSATLSQDSKARLKQFVKECVVDTVYVCVIGSADSKTGTETRNYDLAAARAKVVKEYLVNELNVPENDVFIDTTLDATDDVRTSRSAVLTIVDKNNGEDVD